MAEDEIEAGRRPAGHDESVTANRAWWDREAAAYQAEHGPFLGDADLVWARRGSARLTPGCSGR